MAKKNQDISFKVLLPPNKYSELKVAAANSGMSLAAFMRQASYDAARTQNRQQQAA